MNFLTTPNLHTDESLSRGSEMKASCMAKVAISGMKGWLHAEELIRWISLSRILGARFLAVRRKNYKYGKGKWTLW